MRSLTPDEAGNIFFLMIQAIPHSVIMYDDKIEILVGPRVTVVYRYPDDVFSRTVSIYFDEKEMVLSTDHSKIFRRWLEENRRNLESTWRKHIASGIESKEKASRTNFFGKDHGEIQEKQRIKDYYEKN